MLGDRLLQSNNGEKDITNKERVTFTQLRPGYCGLLGSYFNMIRQDPSVNVFADGGNLPHDVKYIFIYPSHLTKVTPSELWSRLTDSIFSRRENQIKVKHGVKGEQQLDWYMSERVHLSVGPVQKHKGPSLLLDRCNLGYGVWFLVNLWYQYNYLIRMDTHTNHTLWRYY